MYTYLLAGLAIVSVVFNVVLMAANYFVSKHEGRDSDYYIVINMAALHTFLAGVVLYGIWMQ